MLMSKIVPYLPHLIFNKQSIFIQVELCGNQLSDHKPDCHQWATGFHFASAKVMVVTKIMIIVVIMIMMIVMIKTGGKRRNIESREAARLRRRRGGSAPGGRLIYLDEERLRKTIIYYSNLKGWGQSAKLGTHSAICSKLSTALQAYALNPCTKFPPNPTSRKVIT